MSARVVVLVQHIYDTANQITRIWRIIALGVGLVEYRHDLIVYLADEIVLLEAKSDLSLVIQLLHYSRI